MSESDPYAAWEKVRAAKTYPSVIARANEWLQEFFPYAYELGYAPKGLGRQDVWCPKIIISENSPTPCMYVAGWYHQGKKTSIKVVNRNYMKEHAARIRWNVLEYLRDTILHEVQHALDWSRGIDSGTHNPWFQDRLWRLEKDFPKEDLS